MWYMFICGLCQGVIGAVSWQAWGLHKALVAKPVAWGSDRETDGGAHLLHNCLEAVVTITVASK